MGFLQDIINDSRLNITPQGAMTSVLRRPLDTVIDGLATDMAVAPRESGTPAVARHDNQPPPAAAPPATHTTPQQRTVHIETTITPGLADADDPVQRKQPFVQVQAPDSIEQTGPVIRQTVTQDPPLQTPAASPVEQSVATDAAHPVRATAAVTPPFATAQPMSAAARAELQQRDSDAATPHSIPPVHAVQIDSPSAAAGLPRAQSTDAAAPVAVVQRSASLPINAAVVTGVRQREPLNAAPTRASQAHKSVAPGPHQVRIGQVNVIVQTPAQQSRHNKDRERETRDARGLSTLRSL